MSLNTPKATVRILFLFFGEFLCFVSPFLPPSPFMTKMTADKMGYHGAGCWGWVSSSFGQWSEAGTAAVFWDQCFLFSVAFLGTEELERSADGGLILMLSYKAKSSSWEAPAGALMLFWNKAFRSLGTGQSHILRVFEVLLAKRELRRMGAVISSQLASSGSGGCCESMKSSICHGSSSRVGVNMIGGKVRWSRYINSLVVLMRGCLQNSL